MCVQTRKIEFLLDSLEPGRNGVRVLRVAVCVHEHEIIVRPCVPGNGLCRIIDRILIFDDHIDQRQRDADDSFGHFRFQSIHIDAFFRRIEHVFFKSECSFVEVYVVPLEAHYFSSSGTGIYEHVSHEPYLI